jgi:hypothetical protein
VSVAEDHISLSVFHGRTFVLREISANQRPDVRTRIFSLIFSQSYYHKISSREGFLGIEGSKRSQPITASTSTVGFTRDVFRVGYD